MTRSGYLETPLPVMKADNAPIDPGPSYFRFQKAGEKALREKQFEPAKHAFDQALSQAPHGLKATPSIHIAILDLRIEAHLGLKDLDNATKDALNMVRQDRADPRGYLRCGQLSRRRKDFAAAQKWYEQGLKNVPRTNERYHKLELMSSRNVDRIAAPRSKRQDPLTVLPIDLIHMIFDYLSPWEAASCLRVSKTWRNTLLADHSVWKSLDLLGTKKDVTLGSVKACIRRLPKPPSTVRLDKLTVPAATYLGPYLLRWKDIQHLRINIPYLLDLDCTESISTGIKSLHVGDSCPVSFEIINGLLHRCTMLQSARFDAVLRSFPPRDPPHFTVAQDRRPHQKSALPELSHLVLTAKMRLTEEIQNLTPSDIAPIEPLDLFDHFPNLKELRCKGFTLSGSNTDLSSLRSLRHLRLVYCHIRQIFWLPTSLEVLVCTYSTFRFPFLPPSLSSSSESGQQADGLETFSNLKVLELSLCSPKILTLVKIIARSPSATLTSLHLPNPHVELSDLMTLLETGKLSKLTDLCLSQSEANDDTMQRLAAECPLLESATLYTPRITGVTVKELCTSTAIKTLVLRDCFSVSADAIQWARARGLTVVTDQTGEHTRFAGRRIRHD